MTPVAPARIPKNWVRHQVERRVRPARSNTRSRTTTSARSAYDTALHIDEEACEPSQRRQWRRLSKARLDQAQWHQSWLFLSALCVKLLLCLGWTSWLLLLTVAPNDTINFVMRTRNLDNGSFWLLVEPTPLLQALSLSGLSFVALGYLYIGSMLFAWGRHRMLTTVKSGPTTNQLRHTDHTTDALVKAQAQRGSTRRSTSSLASIHPISSSPDHEPPAPGLLSKLAHLYSELWRGESNARKIAHVWVKVVDLMLQEFMLYQILEAGFPIPLVVACTVMVVWNAIAVVALIHSPAPPSQIVEALVDSISDFLVAVVFPLLVLAYCLTNFDFDRGTQRLAADIFPIWSFQNAARVHANPEETAKIFKSLEGLRFQSVGVCVARMGNNFALILSLRRLLQLLRTQASTLPLGDVERKTKKSIYPRKHPLALLLASIALGTIIFVGESVHRSQAACERYPTCTMYAYRWRLSSNTKYWGNRTEWDCPCRVLVDVDLSPANFSVWKNPPNATAVVSDLAASGDLEILQLINRQLPELPDTLRRCTHLKHITLVFTHTLTLPLWTAEFTDLEFLHIQGKSRILSLVLLPQGLFDNMKKLTFVHLGAHELLPKLPNMGGLMNLRSITMERLNAMSALPADFAQLEHLELMIALTMPNLATFPDLSRSRRSLKMLIVDPSALCCNGFLQAGCNLTSVTCGSREFEDTTQLRCLPAAFSATSGTLELFQTFNSTICVNQQGPPPQHPHRPTIPAGSIANVSNPRMPPDPDNDLEQNILQCGGILFRECKTVPDSSPGICYSDRFMPISCMGDPNIIKLRRQQIQEHIGPACNPKYESWLGCTS